MLCISCARGLCSECTDYTLPTGQCCHDRQGESQESALSPEAPPVGRPRKDDDEISTSAGRKRAAVEYEINPQAACEWSGKSNCGGGKIPILGCVGNSQAHRHHGPVKHTARNERGNVHRICARCHNTWHAKNDPIYEKELYETLPHDPRQMTRLEAIQQAAATIKE